VPVACSFSQIIEQNKFRSHPVCFHLLSLFVCAFRATQSSAGRLHCQIQEEICNTITKDPTTSQVCRYTTLWNVKGTPNSVIDWNPGCLGPIVRLDECDVLTPQVHVRQCVPGSVCIFYRMVYQRRRFTTINQLKMCCYRIRLVFQLLLFKTLDISQGSVAIHLRCGGIFSAIIITNFLLILTVK